MARLCYNHNIYTIYILIYNHIIYTIYILIYNHIIYTIYILIYNHIIYTIYILIYNTLLSMSSGMNTITDDPVFIYARICSINTNINYN